MFYIYYFFHTQSIQNLTKMCKFDKITIPCSKSDFRAINQKERRKENDKI